MSGMGMMLKAMGLDADAIQSQMSDTVAGLQKFVQAFEQMKTQLDRIEARLKNIEMGQLADRWNDTLEKASWENGAGLPSPEYNDYINHDTLPKGAQE